MTDIYEAREMLSHIPCSALSYQDWVNVGAALHNEVSEIHHFSR